MKTRKGEPVIVVPEEQQQIVELERQLAEANKRIETLTRRLEAAEERAEAWEEAALGKTGKLEFDEMERSWRETVVRAEEAEQQVKELERDIQEWYQPEMNRQHKVILDVTERLRQAEAELAAIDRVLEEGEITTVGASFANTADAIRETIAALRQAEAERDELQRKLDACQCETRVLNESMLIEAKQERDQLRAELATMREALELVKPARQDTYGWQRTDGHIDNCGCDWCVVNRALASTPHAAKAAERVKAMEMSLRAAHHELTTLHGLWACDNFDVYDGALVDGCDHNAAWERFCDEMWQIDTAKPIEQIDNALTTTPNAAKAAERVKATGNVVQAARELTVNFESRTYRAPHHGDGWEAIKHEVYLRDQLRDALDRLEVLER